MVNCFRSVLVGQTNGGGDLIFIDALMLKFAVASQPLSDLKCVLFNLGFVLIGHVKLLSQRYQVRWKGKRYCGECAYIRPHSPHAQSPRELVFPAGFSTSG